MRPRRFMIGVGTGIVAAIALLVGGLRLGEHSVDPATGLWRVPGRYAAQIADWTPTVAFLLLAGLILGAALTRQWRSVILAVFSTAVIVVSYFPLSFFGSTNITGEHRVKAADGETYVLLGSGFQDWLYWLGRVEDESDWNVHIRPLARTDDFSAQNMRLVRPRSAGDASDGLRTDASKRFVVLDPWPACASIVLDTQTKQIWSGAEFDRMPSDPIADVSPFLLLGPTDELNPDDVARLIAAEPHRCPRSKSLSELDPARFADHPNPAVRELVRTSGDAQK